MTDEEKTEMENAVITVALTLRVFSVEERDHIIEWAKKLAEKYSYEKSEL